MNTAGRLLSIYDRLIGKTYSNNVTMLSLWAEVFELPPDSPNLEDEVVACLQAMRSEMALFSSKLQALGVSEELLQPGLRRLRLVSSTTLINSRWDTLRNDVVMPENRLSFAWAEWALHEDTEEDISSSELEGLLSELNSLQASLQVTDMTPYLKDFIQRQIDVIRTALKVYRVQGVKPIQTALQNVVGAYTVEKSRVDTERARASESGKSLLARTGAFITKTATVADELDKIRKAGEGVYKLAVTVGTLLLN